MAHPAGNSSQAYLTMKAVLLIKDKYNLWTEEGREIEDPRALWDFIKYKIRQETITYSKTKARKRKEELINSEKISKIDT